MKVGELIPDGKRPKTKTAKMKQKRWEARKWYPNKLTTQADWRVR